MTVPHPDVFIGSTYEDLKAHRAEVQKTVLSLEFFPVAMENFSATDANAVKACIDKVNRSDVYIGIFAHRYGYRPGDGELSITEMEYNRAGEIKIPRLCFLVDEKYDKWDPKQIDGEPDKSRLQRLKARINTEHVRSKFTSPESLALEIAKALYTVKPRPRYDYPLGSSKAFDVSLPIVETAQPAKTQMASLILFLDGNFDQFEANRLRNDLSKLLRLDMSDINIAAVAKGSVIVYLQMPAEAAFRLYNLVRGGSGASGSQTSQSFFARLLRGLSSLIYTLLRLIFILLVLVLIAGAVWKWGPDVVASLSPSLGNTYALSDTTPTKTPAKRLTVTPTRPPTCGGIVVLAPTLNVRIGPGTNYTSIGKVAKGQRLSAFGRNADGSWLTLDFQGKQGWITADPSLVNISCNVSKLSVMQASSAPNSAPIVAPKVTSPTPVITSPQADSPTAMPPSIVEVSAVKLSQSQIDATTNQQTVVGYLYLEAPANSGGETVYLSSSDPSVAFVDKAVSVGAGSDQATFYITINPYFETSGKSYYVTITAIADKIARSATLEVRHPFG